MAKIIFLGTAAAIGTKERDNTAILIREGKKILLVDCPGAIVAKLNKVNIDFKKINTILFTHMHPDHIYGLVSLLHSQYQLHNQIRIFATKRTIQLIKKLRDLFSLNDTKKFPKLVFKTIRPGFNKAFYNSRDIRIWPLKVIHSPASVGFKFRFKRKNISCIFSGDTAFNQDLIEIAKNTDYLIHDCFATSRIFKRYKYLNMMHTSSLNLGKLAKKAKVRTLVPIHFAVETNFSFNTLRKEIRRNFKGRLILPKDLMNLELTD